MAMKTIRTGVPDEINEFTIPKGVSFIVIKNVGANDLRIQSEGEGANYWTIKTGETTPIMKVNTGQVVKTDGVGGSTTVEVLMWE